MDRAYSFDLGDCERHPELSLLPLFYGPAFAAIGDVQPEPPDYDLVSVYTAHANRYATMSHVFPALRRRGVRIYSYAYLNPLQYAYNRFRVPEFRHASAAEFRFRPLDTDEAVRALSDSRAVFDMNHAGQTGLTMRTIETLGARRGLVTTNESVRRYGFYDPSRVLVVDPVAPDADAIAAFVAGPVPRLDAEQYHLYSLASWVEEIITGRRHHHDEVYVH